MKLTEKGLNRLVENTKRCSLDGCWSVRPIGPAQVDALKSFEFDSGDFAGAVVLTVEEAKQVIGDYTNTNAEIVRRYKIPELKIKHPKSIVLLMERIEQAEC